MATARAYYYDYGSAAPKRERRREENPDVRVVPGRRRAAQPAALPPQAVSAFKLAMLVVAVVAVIAGARVWLSASNVASLVAIDALEQQVDSAFATGDELEVQHSLLASPTRIEKEASELGMKAAEKTTYLKVVLPAKAALNTNGTISLAATIDNVESAALA